MRNKLLSVLLLSSLAACASEYKRVPIPANEQEHKAVPKAPELQHVEWKVLRYQGRDYYALDSQNMSVLNENLVKMAQYNALETRDFQAYETAHPAKTTKVVREQNFWVFWNKWWFGCNDKEFQNSPSCRPFVAPDDYVEPTEAEKQAAHAQAQKTVDSAIAPTASRENAPEATLSPNR